MRRTAVTRAERSRADPSSDGVARAAGSTSRPVGNVALANHSWSGEHPLAQGRKSGTGSEETELFAKFARGRIEGLLAGGSTRPAGSSHRRPSWAGAIGRNATEDGRHCEETGVALGHPPGSSGLPSRPHRERLAWRYHRETGPALCRLGRRDQVDPLEIQSPPVARAVAVQSRVTERSIAGVTGR